MGVHRNIADSAIDEFALDALKFSPKGVWKTFVVLFRSSWSDSRALADAIVEADRTQTLSPFKYIAGSWTVGFLVLWLAGGIIGGELGEYENFSFLNPEILPLLIWPFIFAIPLHFILGVGHRPESQVISFTDGISKIYKMYMYMLGHFMFFFVPVFFGVMIDNAVIAFAVSAVGAVAILYPMVLRAMPGTLAALYGVSRDRALFSAIGLGMAIFCAHSLVVTGELPQ